MALTSVYYDGPVTETDRARNLAGAPEYGVYGADDFKVTAHPSIPYAVLVRAGRAHGHGVTDTAAVDQVVQCATLATGTRWDLIVVRRNWQPALGGPSTLEVIQAGATAQIPAARKIGPGVEDDQPLFLVKWQGGVSAPVDFIDLRVWTGNNGLFAKSYLVRSYLTSVGTAVRIGDAVRSLKLGDNDVPTWVKDNPAVFSVLGGAGVPVVSAGEVYAQTNNYSVGRIAFDTPFPKACRSVVLQNSTGALDAVSLRVLQKTATYVDFVAYGPNGAGLPNSGLYVNYIAVGD